MRRWIPLLLGLVAAVFAAVLAMAPPGPMGSGAAERPGPAGSDPPWSLPASWEVETREITFQSDGRLLRGTLHVPSGARNGPAVVVVQQAGTTTRDVPLFVQIAESFTAIGFSVFLYDRRGQGESEGDPGRPDYLALARDAAAAKRAIGREDAVDPGRVGFWGLSQSGWIAMEAGLISEPAFVIAVGSPLTTPAEQMEFLAHNYVLLEGYGEAAAERAREVRAAVMGDFFRGDLAFEEARDLLRTVENEPWFERSFLPTSDRLPEDPTESGWILEMDFDPVRAFEGLAAPLLFLLGGEDVDVPVARTLEIAGDLGDREEREIVVIPGANHLMRIEEDPTDQFRMAPGDVSNSGTYFLVMGGWLGRLGLADSAHGSR